MRKIITYYLILALMSASCFLSIPAHKANAQAAYNLDRQTFTIATSGNSITYNNVKGVLNFSVEEKFTGGATNTVTIQGCMVGGTCQTIDSYVSTANTIRSITGLYTSLIVTASFSGGTNPVATFNVYASANSAPSSIVYLYVNITTNTSTQVKTGAGFLHQVIISTKGTTLNTMTMFDNTACSGTKIATIDTTAQGASFAYDVQFNTGLCITTATGTAGDFTISYR